MILAFIPAYHCLPNDSSMHPSLNHTISRFEEQKKWRISSSTGLSRWNIPHSVIATLSQGSKTKSCSKVLRGGAVLNSWCEVVSIQFTAPQFPLPEQSSASLVFHATRARPSPPKLHHWPAEGTFRVSAHTFHSEHLHLQASSVHRKEILVPRHLIGCWNSTRFVEKKRSS